MTWELALGLVGVIVSHIGVEVYRHWRARGRETREQDVIVATSSLTVAQAQLAAEEAEGKKLDRTERLYKIVDGLREQMRVQKEGLDNLSDMLETEQEARITSERKMQILSDELDAERSARQDSELKLRGKLKMSVSFAETLITLIPPPPPEFPEGWSELHDFEDTE